MFTTATFFRMIATRSSRRKTRSDDAIVQKSITPVQITYNRKKRSRTGCSDTPDAKRSRTTDITSSTVAKRNLKKQRRMLVKASKLINHAIRRAQLRVKEAKVKMLFLKQIGLMNINAPQWCMVHYPSSRLSGTTRLLASLPKQDIVEQRFLEKRRFRTRIDDCTYVVDFEQRSVTVKKFKFDLVWLPGVMFKVTDWIQRNVLGVKQIIYSSHEEMISLTPKCDVVFHGTTTENAKAIMQSGFNSKFRRQQMLGPGEYFSHNLILARGYGQSVVLTKVTNAIQHGEVVVCQDNAAEIPLATLLF